MKHKKSIVLVLLISILYMSGCKNNNPPSNNNGSIDINYQSSNVETTYDSITVSNCTGDAALEYGIERTIEISTSGKSEQIKKIIVSEISSFSKNIKNYISVPPYSAINAEIFWREEVITGSYSIYGEIGTFIARVPLSVDIVNGSSYECSGNNSSNYPQFPWPPPQSSTSTEINLVIKKEVSEGAPKLSDVDEKITAALLQSGYDERSYWEVPNGFVISTRLERIERNGTPDYDRRWENSLSPISFDNFSLSEYINALFGAPEGYYRVFVFIVTTDIIVPSGTPISQAEAETFGSNGASGLPTEIVSLPYTSNYNCLVYVYEFVQSGIGQIPQQKLNSETTASEHLYRTGLLPYLEDTP